MIDLKALKKLMKGIWGCWDRLPFYVEENLVTDWFVCNLLRESVPKLLFEILSVGFILFIRVIFFTIPTK